MGRATVRAFPRPHGQRQGLADKPATVAAFAGRKEPVDFDIRPTCPCGLVFQLASQLPPAGIGDMFGQCRVFNHVLHREVFSTNYLVFVNQFAG